MTVSRASVMRRGWIVPLCVVIVTVAAVIVAGSRSSYYRTQGSLVVYGAGTAAASPADLAVTYAELIARDDGVIEAISRATGVPADLVANRLTAVQQPETAIITVTYADADAKRSLLGVYTALHAVTGRHPAAAGIPSSALRIVSAPGTPSKQQSKLPGGPVPIGIVLGLFLGIGLFLAWERSDARADDSRSLERELGMPVTDLPFGLTGGELSAVQRRWSTLAGGRSGSTVALVDATRGSAAMSRDISQSLAQSSTSDGSTYVRAHAPGVVDGDDVATMDADLTVLVVARGERVAEIRSNIAALRKLGIEPRWALLAG